MRLFLVLISLLWTTCAFGQTVVGVPAKTNPAVVEGTLVQVSKLPAASDNPYPDCYYTATIEVAAIVSGANVPKRFVLVLPGFFSRQYAPEAKFKVGDRVHATVVPFASMPDKVRQTQQADEVEDVDLEFYFPTQIAPIKDFQKPATAVPFSEQSQKPKSPTTFQAIDQKAQKTRKETIQRDLDEINALLAKHGGDWDHWYNSLQDFREKYDKQYKEKTQLWVGDSFFSAGSVSDRKAYNPDFIKSVIAFKTYLAARNVDLILVRIPYKGEIVDDLFVPPPPDKVTNPYLLKMYKELLEADVEIVTDIIPRAKQARLKYPLMFWYADFDERHPAEGMAWVAAESLENRVRRYEKLADKPKTNLKLKKVSTASDAESWLWAVEKRNPFWPAGNARFNPKEHVEFSAVSTGDGTPLGRQLGVDSPVLLVGSSFTEYPSLRLGANIPSYIAYLTGVIPDILYRAGSDASIPRIIAREGDAYLKNRVVCLFPMVPMAFESPLDVPPIIDPTKSVKVLLETYNQSNLADHLQFTAGARKETVASYVDGNLTLNGLVKDSRVRFDLSLKLPKAISDFPFFLIEMETRPGDASIFNAKYGTQMDALHKSYSQKNSDDIFIFKTEKSYAVDLGISNIRSDIPTIITKIKIYGIRQQ